MLMLGREVVTPTELLFPGAKPVVKENSEYLRDLRDAILDAHEIARNSLKEKTTYMKKYYDRNVNCNPTFRVGDPVYILKKGKRKGVCSKLNPRFEGPMVIIEVKSPYLFKVLIDNRIQKIVHHDYIKPCTDREMPKWIAKAKNDLIKVGEQRFCFCNKPYDGTRMIQCDSCKNWFHIKCVNIKWKNITADKEYYCTNCL